MGKKQHSQSKKSAAAKKASKGLRNVLAKPQKTQCSLLGDDEESCLEELLSRLLPGLKRHAHTVPWSQLRKLGKDERRAAKEKLATDCKEMKNDNAALKSITLGVNAVTRNLEKDRLCSVLLDSGVESLMIKHVIFMAQNKNIPILMVPFLKKVTLGSLGFASAAMGLKIVTIKLYVPKHEATESTHPFYEVHEETVKFAKVISIDAVTPSKDLLTRPEEVEDTRIEVEKKDSSSTYVPLSTSVYMYRNTRQERSFVPASSTEKSSSDSEERQDFIGLGEDTGMGAPTFFGSRKNQRYMDICVAEKKRTRENEEPMSVDCKTQVAAKKKKSSVTYLPLKVKRIQGNNNRIKATRSKNKSSSKKK